MTPEIYTIIGSAVALGGLILNGQHSINTRLSRLERDVADLRERVATLEGELRGFMAGFKAQAAN